MRYLITILLLCSISAQAQKKIVKAETDCNHKFVKVEPDTVIQLSPYSWSSVGPELICVFCYKVKRQTIQVDEIAKYPYLQMLRIDSLSVHPAFWYVDHSKIPNESYSYHGWLPSEYKPDMKPNRFRKAAKEAALKTNQQLKINNK